MRWWLAGRRCLLVTIVVLTASCVRSSERAAESPSISPAHSPSAGVSPRQSSPSPSGSPSATGQDPTWHRSLGFSGTAVATDDDGNAYVTGFVPAGPVEAFGQAWEMVLERFDPDGDRVWTARWASASRRYPHAAGMDVAVSPGAGLVYVAGATMNDSTEVRRARLWAYSLRGRFRWTSPIARTGSAMAVAAASTGAVAAGSDWLGAWGSDGALRWIRSFEEPATDRCDIVNDLAVERGGAIYAAGFLDATPTCGSMEGGVYEDADIVIQKRSADGDLLWSRILADPGDPDNDRALAIDVGLRRVLVAGERDGRAWLAGVSGDGVVDWERSWGGAGSQVAGVNGSPWGAVYVLEPSGRLRRFSAAGELVWDRRLRLEDERTASGVASGVGDVVYVIASIFAAEGDLWRTTA
jgi:hypothetical protein